MPINRRSPIQRITEVIANRDNSARENFSICFETRYRISRKGITRRVIDKKIAKSWNSVDKLSWISPTNSKLILERKIAVRRGVGGTIHDENNRAT